MGKIEKDAYYSPKNLDLRFLDYDIYAQYITRRGIWR